jgi:hypothetical protein
MPKLTHPDSKLALDAADDQVPMYVSQGWVLGSGSKSTSATKKEKP